MLIKFVFASVFFFYKIMYDSLFVYITPGVDHIRASTMETWAPSQYKGGLRRYGDSHVNDKTVAWDPYSGKMTPLYRDARLVHFVNAIQIGFQ